MLYGPPLSKNGPSTKGGGALWEPHESNNVCAIVAGGASGNHQGGSYLAPHAPYANLLVSALGLLGFDDTQFGPLSTGKINGLV